MRETGKALNNGRQKTDDRYFSQQAAAITAQLKTKRKSIDKPDLFIAATAVANGLTFDTLNVKHFTHIDKLLLLGK